MRARLALIGFLLLVPALSLAQDESPTSAPTTSEAPETPTDGEEPALPAVPVIEGRHARVTLVLTGVTEPTFIVHYRLASPAGEREDDVAVTRDEASGAYTLELDLDHDVTPCDATELLVTRPDTGEQVYIMLDYSWIFGC